MNVNGVWWAALAVGAAAALPKERKHNLMKLPSFRGKAEVRSSLPGRMRLYMPAVSQAREQAEQMKAQLVGWAERACICPSVSFRSSKAVRSTSSTVYPAG